MNPYDPPQTIVTNKKRDYTLLWSILTEWIAVVIVASTFASATYTIIRILS